MVNQLFKAFSDLPQVEAVALGGSRAGTRFDEKSDYDVYLYCSEFIPVEIRDNILKQFCSYMELGNSFWEYEDNCILNNGIDIDILYRDLDHFTKDVAAVVEQHIPRNGYTTCMWHNLLNCKILYDRDGRLTAAQHRFSVPYPPQLKANIIERNWKLLRSAMPAYEAQICKAVRRNDLISINHRVSAFFESYFDILFALNEKTHPGEKRLISICRDSCSRLPHNFDNDVTTLLSHMFAQPESIAKDLDKILTELAKIL